MSDKVARTGRAGNLVRKLSWTEADGVRDLERGIDLWGGLLCWLGDDAADGRTAEVEGSRDAVLATFAQTSDQRGSQNLRTIRTGSPAAAPF